MTDLDGLARVTVSAPARRVDVALPEHAPLAELLPELLRHAGDGLADVGQAHGGWVLRRTDGVALSVAAGLATQGVRDGAVLHLVPARTSWPELEYDDVVDAIAAGARRYGRGWDGTVTRATALALGAVAALLGLVELIRAARPGATAPVALAATVLLLFAGALASRAYGTHRPAPRWPGTRCRTRHSAASPCSPPTATPYSPARTCWSAPWRYCWPASPGHSVWGLRCDCSWPVRWSAARG